MSKIIENESDLDKMLKENSKLVVLFYASWCPHSQRFLPIFEKYSEDKKLTFCRVVTDEAPDCEEKHSIDVVPTVIYFENGQAAKRLDGIPGRGLTETQLSGLIRSCDQSSGK